MITISYYCENNIYSEFEQNKGHSFSFFYYPPLNLQICLLREAITFFQ